LRPAKAVRTTLHAAGFPEEALVGENPQPSRTGILFMPPGGNIAPEQSLLSHPSGKFFPGYAFQEYSMDSSIAALTGYQATQSVTWPDSKILGKNTGTASESDSEDSDPVTKLKKQIEELEKKIAEVEQSSLPDNAKQAVVKGLQTQMAALTQQLAQLTAQSSTAGGTASGSSLAGSGKSSGGKV
jgi:hypothetical protein